MKFLLNPTKLKEDFERIFRLLPIEGADRTFLEMIVIYALNVSEITEAQLGEPLKSIPEPLKEKIMTPYAMLIEKGLEKGKLEEKNEVIVNLFDEGFPTPKITKIVQLLEEEVVDILKGKGRLK